MRFKGQLAKRSKKCIVLYRHLPHITLGISLSSSSLPEKDCPDKGFPDGFFMTTHEEVGIWWGSLSSHGCVNKLEKIPVHE